jgi:hypothetical protein
MKNKMVIARAKPVAIYDSEFNNVDCFTSFAMTHFFFVGCCVAPFSFLYPVAFLYRSTFPDMIIRWASDVPS